MTTSAAVTALVPTYQSADFVADTVASLRAQDHPELAILISDDASTDETAARCEALAASDPRIKVVQQLRRRGWLGNSQALVDLADSPFVFFAPHDDLFAATYVSRCVAALACRPDAVLAFADTLQVELDGSARVMTSEVATIGGPAARMRPFVRGGDEGRWLPYRGVVRLDALRASGPLVGRGREADADGRLLLRLAALGPFVRIPEVLIERRMQPTSLSESWTRDWPREALAYIPDILGTGVPLGQRGALTAAAVAKAAGRWAALRGVHPRHLARQLARR